MSRHLARRWAVFSAVMLLLLVTALGCKPKSSTSTSTDTLPLTTAEKTGAPAGSVQPAPTAQDTADAAAGIRWSDLAAKEWKAAQTVAAKSTDLASDAHWETVKDDGERAVAMIGDDAKGQWVVALFRRIGGTWEYVDAFARPATEFSAEEMAAWVAIEYPEFTEELVQSAWGAQTRFPNEESARDAEF